MDRLFSKNTKLDSVLMIFVSVLLLSFHFYFIYFVNSTYISAFVGEKLVSIVYGIGALLSIILFIQAPRLLRKFGVVQLTIGLALIEALSVIFLAFPLHPVIAIGAFLVHMLVASVLLYCIDMLLEAYSKSSETGSIRGTFLTVWNIPPIITPFVAGLIIADKDLNLSDLGGGAVRALHLAGFWKIYLISALFLIPFIVIIKSNFSKFKDLDYPIVAIRPALASFYKNHNIFDIFADRLLLNLYFAWTVVYLPIYLYEYVGFSWNEIGILFSVMLLPYILFERIIGKIEDKSHDEKHLLIWGFFLLALGSIIQPLLDTPDLYAWIILLFMSHVGAAFIEVSTESFFFRHVKPTNSTFISLFRMTRTLPYLILPLIVSISLYFLPFGHMFFILGLIMFLGMRYAFMIRD